MFDKTAAYTITAPAAVDGLGAVAVLNSAASGNYVGDLLGLTRSVDIRQAEDALLEEHGVVLGDQWYGHAAYTMKVLLALGANWAASYVNRDKLFAATNAMAADLTVGFTETGGVAKQFTARRSSYPQGMDDDRIVTLEMIGADPRIYGTTAAASANPYTPGGAVLTPPTFTLTPSGNPVTIQNVTTGKALVLIVGAGYLTATFPVTVNFKDKTITQFGALVPQALDYSSSDWWGLIPGANTWSITNGGTNSVQAFPAWI